MVHEGSLPPLPGPELTFQVPKDRVARENFLAQAVHAFLPRLAASLWALLDKPGPMDLWMEPSIGMVRHALFSICERTFSWILMDASRLEQMVFWHSNVPHLMINTGIPYEGDTLVAAFVWGDGSWIMEHLIESQQCQWRHPIHQDQFPVAYRRPAPKRLRRKWPTLKRYLEDHPGKIPLLDTKHRIFGHVFTEDQGQRRQRFQQIVGDHVSEERMMDALIWSLHYLWDHPETKLSTLCSTAAFLFGLLPFKDVMFHDAQSQPTSISVVWYFGVVTTKHN